MDLKPEHRRDLRTLADTHTRALFERLHGSYLDQLHGRMVQALHKCPDKSGQTSPTTTATRRVFLWRVHCLTGRHHATTAHYWQALSGKPFTRQQVARQIAAVEPFAAEVGKLWKCAAGP